MSELCMSSIHSTHVDAFAGGTAAPVQPVISLSENALNHLHKLRAESGGDELLLRIGVKSGGCSGTALVPHPKQLLC
jgi:hypothetical protein